MLDVGIIGLGPQWEQRYRPALRRLKDRIGIRAIYDPIPGRADLAAADSRAAVCRSMLGVVSFSRVRAVLILDDAWRRDAALSFVVAREKPAFVADFSAFSLGERFAGNLSRVKTAPMLLPGLSLRYTPVTCRLRELMATRLGTPLEIQSDAHGLADVASRPFRLIELCDWCQYLMGTPAEEVRVAGEHDVQIKFKQTKRGSDTAVAHLTFPSTGAEDSLPQETQPDRSIRESRIICERGTATLAGTNEITWTHAGSTRTEHLEGEREATELLLDLFCRRVHGGLAPVPTPQDVAAAAQIAAAVESSRNTGRAHHF